MFRKTVESIQPYTTCELKMPSRFSVATIA